MLRSRPDEISPDPGLAFALALACALALGMTPARAGGSGFELLGSPVSQGQGVREKMDGRESCLRADDAGQVLGPACVDRAASSPVWPARDAPHHLSSPPLSSDRDSRDGFSS